MSILKEKFTLSNGIKIPKIGLGTWQVSDEEVENTVKIAIKNGYTHIDTANGYENERGVGRGIMGSDIARENIFVTTKILDTCKSYEGAKKQIKESLENLNLGYIDLLLIHSPKPWKELFEDSEKTYFQENIEVWRAMEEAYREGQIKAIGVSNFEICDIENIMENCEIKPMINQIKYHIGWTQDELVAFCKENEIIVEGFSPICTGDLLENVEVKKIAKKYGKTVPQICIAYVLEKNILPLPKSKHEAYIIQNSEVNFSIFAEDMEYLDKVRGVVVR